MILTMTPNKFWSFTSSVCLALLLLCSKMMLSLPINTDAETIIVGGDETSDIPVGWTDGVCYLPIRNAQVGDELQFDLTGDHNVYKMASQKHYEDCNFTDALLLQEGGVSTSYLYRINDQDKMDGSIYFSCRRGSHCMVGQQKLQVDIFPLPTDTAIRDVLPKSDVVLGVSSDDCKASQMAADSGANFGSAEDENNESNEMESSTCTDPALQEDGKTHFVSCLSPPATMTPGGVINNLFLLHYPYPTDRRVALGLRMWEFVSGDPNNNDPLIPVPINQLYIHHLSGNIVLGQGTEGVRRSEPDAIFPDPYKAVTGNEGDMMKFHLIDLREVDDWLPCLECRCRDPIDGTYLNVGTANETGGVNCCTNCTSLVGPTIDYRMRYNVTYFDIPEDEPVREVQMVSADISPAVNRVIEYDVPSKEFLPLEQQKNLVTHPWIQRLTRTMPFRDMMKMDFFGDDYNGPDEVKLLRCVAYLHIASMGMWLIDDVTNETLCEGTTEYGTDPTQDKGFLKAVEVNSYDPPKVFPASRNVSLIVDYNATEIHTGVMGMYFLFIEGSHGPISASETPLVVDLCQPAICNATLLPFPTEEDEEEDDIGVIPKTVENEECVDQLADSPACRFGGLCDCETMVNAPETTEEKCNEGGVYVSPMGNITIWDVCANYCGCPLKNSSVQPSPDDTTTSEAAQGFTGSSDCPDKIADHPLCRFGDLCDCETLVNANETVGDGCSSGVYVAPNGLGNITIIEICPSYCNNCPALDVQREEELQTYMEDELRRRCPYATEECRMTLNNLYKCSTVDDPTIISKDDIVKQNVVHTQGRMLALKHAKLGSPSVHRGTKDEYQKTVEQCVETEEPFTSSRTNSDDSAAVKLAARTISNHWTLLLLASATTLFSFVTW